MNTKNKPRKASRKPAISIADWAAKSSANTGGHRCHACIASKRVRDALVELLALRRAGLTRVSMRQVSLMIKDRFDETVSQNSLQGHFSNCLKSPWGRTGERN